MRKKAVKIPHRLRKICQLRINGVDRLLDIGCGNGASSLLLGKAFGVNELYGVDMSAESISIAKTKGINAVYVNVDESVLPFEDKSFDVIFAGEIIEHLLNPDFLLDEIYRVMKPNGKCIITTPNLASWYNRIQLMLGYQPYAIPASHVYRGAGAFWSIARDKVVYGDCFSLSTNDGGFKYHIRFYTLRGIEGLLKVHKFKIVKVMGASFDEVVFEMPMLLKKVVRLTDMAISEMFRSLASRSIIVVERKPDVG